MVSNIYEYYEELIEAFNPIYDEPELDVLMEGSSKNYMSPSDVKEGEVIHCTFPFLHIDDNGNDDKHRWALVVKIDGELKVVMCSALNSKEKIRKSKFPSNYVIKGDYKKYGFSKPTFIVGNVVLPIEMVSEIKHKGWLPKIEYDRAMKRILSRIKFKMADPWAFLSWCIMHRVGETIPVDGVSNNSNKLQSINDIFDSCKVNCVDITSAVHGICVSRNIPHYLVRSTFKHPEENKSSGHLYCVFKYKNIPRVFKYIPVENSPPIAEIKSYPNKTIDQIVSAESKWLKSHHDEVLGCDSIPENNILTEDDVILWDTAVASRKVQSELMNALFYPADLHKRLSSYKWGVMSDGIDITNEPDCFSKYKTLSIVDFDNYKIGTCWDYVSYQFWYFKEFISLLKTKNWMIDSEPNGDASTNHTWMSFNKGKSVYAFEASFKKFSNIMKFDTEKEMIEWYSEHAVADKNNFAVLSFYPPDTGISAEEYMLKVISSGEIVAKTGDHFKKLEKVKATGTWDGWDK